MTNQDVVFWRSQIVMSNPSARMGLRALMTPPEPKKRPIGFITPEEFQKKLREEAAHWTKVVQQYGIKAE